MDMIDRISAVVSRAAAEIKALREGGFVPPYLTYEEPLAAGSVITCVSPWVTTTYQWKRNGVNIAGATAATYTLVTADSETSITCVASGSDLLSGGVTAPVIEGEDFVSGWNTEALEAPDMTFSNGNRTVVGNDAGGMGNNRCLSLASKSTGKWFASLSIDAYEYGDVSVTDSADANYVHFDYAGVVWSSAGVQLDTLDGYHAPCVVDISINANVHLVWFRVDGADWNGDAAADPETNTGGYALPVSALPYHVKAQMPYFAGSRRTLNVGEAAFPYPAPAGFLPFGTP